MHAGQGGHFEARQHRVAQDHHDLDCLHLCRAFLWRDLFAILLQQGAQGRLVCTAAIDEAYRHLLEKYSIQPEAFYGKLHSEEYKEMAYYEFSLMKQLQVTGYPCVFIQTGELKFVMVARGFTSYEDLKQRMEAVLLENN